MNEKIHVVRREGMEYIYNFGDGGRTPGQFYGAHSIATDSNGNIYTTETYEGKRIQKHLYRGMGPATEWVDGGRLAELEPSTLEPAFTLRETTGPRDWSAGRAALCL